MIYEVKNLSFRYPGRPEDTLNGVDISLHRGEVLTILGPNGAGKSTLLKCMLGLLAPRDGSIRLCGRPLSRLSVRETAAMASYVPQSQPEVFPYLVEDFVLMGRSPVLGPFGRPGKADREAAERAMAAAGITHMAKRSLNEISGGERQQAMIARAIVCQPHAILLDEPTAHLDYGNQLRTLRMIKALSRQGYAVAVTTHNPDHALLLGGSTAILDRRGRLTLGKTEEIVTELALNDVYGTAIQLCYVPEAERAVCIYPKL